MSTLPAGDRDRLDTLAGLMAATAIFVGLLASFGIDLSISGTHLRMTPVKLGLPAMALALFAAALDGRHRRLAAVAVALTCLFWVIGMVLAIVTGNPLY